MSRDNLVKACFKNFPLKIVSRASKIRVFFLLALTLGVPSVLIANSVGFLAATGIYFFTLAVCASSLFSKQNVMEGSEVICQETDFVLTLNGDRFSIKWTMIQDVILWPGGHTRPPFIIHLRPGVKVDWPVAWTFGPFRKMTWIGDLCFGQLADQEDERELYNLMIKKIQENFGNV
jgi:hypothetical protein